TGAWGSTGIPLDRLIESDEAEVNTVGLLEAAPDRLPRRLGCNLRFVRLPPIPAVEGDGHRRGIGPEHLDESSAHLVGPFCDLGGETVVATRQHHRPRRVDARRGEQHPYRAEHTGAWP